MSHKRFNHSTSTTSGFSLVEIVMVVAIVAILGALLAPRYAGTVTRFKVDGAARRIVADLALAQHHARMNGASRTVAFDLTTHQYTLKSVPDRYNAAIDYQVDLTDETYGAKITAFNLVTNVSDSIIFDGYGAPNTGGTITVTVGSESRALAIDGETGQAKLQ